MLCVMLAFFFVVVVVLVFAISIDLLLLHFELVSNCYGFDDLIVSCVEFIELYVHLRVRVCNYNYQKKDKTVPIRNFHTFS